MTTRRYTFSGVTDPDCTVTVGGKYHATVETDGSWALDLMLGPGRNSTTFVATDPQTGLETKQAIRVYYAEELELRMDGLGAVAFGDNETDTMAILSGLLGEPEQLPRTRTVCDDLDDCDGAGYGWCRYVYEAFWESEKLSIVITDCETQDGWPDAPELVGWRAWLGTTLRTPEGVGPGSTLGEMRAAYGEKLYVGFDDCAGRLFFAVRSPDGSEGFHGYIPPQPPGFQPPDGSEPHGHDVGLDPATVVTRLEAGDRQSC
ncbi:MAG: hypothetical protein WBO25_01190 [Acidimicrobiia bacterium]